LEGFSEYFSVFLSSTKISTQRDNVSYVGKIQKARINKYPGETVLVLDLVGNIDCSAL